MPKEENSDFVNTENITLKKKLEEEKWKNGQSNIIEGIDAQNISSWQKKCNLLEPIRLIPNPKRYIWNPDMVEKQTSSRESFSLNLQSLISRDPESISNGKATLKHKITISRKENFIYKYFSKYYCIICLMNFKTDQEFEKHLEKHGPQFEIPPNSQNQQVLTKKLKLEFSFNNEIDEFFFRVINVTSSECTIKRVFLVAVEDNWIISLNTTMWPKAVPSGLSAVFSVENKRFSRMLHPYSILILYHIGHDNVVITRECIEQYHFTIIEQYLSNLGKKFRAGFYGLREIMVLIKLPDYFPSKEMKFLFRHDFKNVALSPLLDVLLRRIRMYVDADKEVRLNSNNYSFILRTLIEIEDLQIEKDMRAFDKFNQKIFYRNGYVVFGVPNLSDHRPSLLNGDQLFFMEQYGKVDPVRLNERLFKDEKIYGFILRVARDHIVIKLENKDSKLKTDKLYRVHFIPNRMTIRLEHQALEIVEQENLSEFFFPNENVLSRLENTSPLDANADMDWCNENIVDNPEQRSAICHVLASSSYPAPYIIFGPPGTGKTMTIVEIIGQLWKTKPSTHILVTATSNAACNEIASRLLKFIPPSDIYRMFSLGQEHKIDLINDDLLDISNLNSGSHYYPPLEEIYKIRIVLTTLTVAGKFAQAGINRKHFSHVVIDECGSATETSVLIAIAGIINGFKKIYGNIILAGDPKQLGPIIASEKANQMGLGLSLLERLIDSGIYAKNSTTNEYDPKFITRLRRNFRSHPKILEFPNNMFYDGTLIPAAGKDQTHFAINWKRLSQKNIPIIFKSVLDDCSQDKNSPSWYNMSEIREVMFYVRDILENGINRKKFTQNDIGIISPYKKQCIKIKDECEKKKWGNIEIGSVEQFQGQEKSIIILSTVRSNMKNVGFLNNPKRLNVALTRAKGLLIIIGNPYTLQLDENWNLLIKFCRDQNLFVDPYIKKSDGGKGQPVKRNERKDKLKPLDFYLSLNDD